MYKVEELINSLSKYRGGEVDFLITNERIQTKQLFKKFSRVILRKFYRKFINRFVFPVKVKTFFGFSMITAITESDLWIHGLKLHPAELRLTIFLIRNIKSNDIFFDIGAHHGFYSLLVSDLLEDKIKIYAFEPSEMHFKILSKNIKDKKNIFVNKLALYSEEGYLKFYENPRESSTINRDFFKDVSTFKKEKFFETKVWATTLDKFCRTNNIGPTFLKIDVEGAEYNVLLGSREVLKNYSPIVALEVWRKPFDNRNHLKAINFLTSIGYRPFRINHQGLLEEVSKIIPEINIPINEQIDNFIFKK